MPHTHRMRASVVVRCGDISRRLEAGATLDPDELLHGQYTLGDALAPAHFEPIDAPSASDLDLDHEETT